MLATWVAKCRIKKPTKIEFGNFIIKFSTIPELFLFYTNSIFKISNQELQKLEPYSAKVIVNLYYFFPPTLKNQKFISVHNKFIII